jgi:hypothetical protein
MHRLLAVSILHLVRQWGQAAARPADRPAPEPPTYQRLPRIWGGRTGRAEPREAMVSEAGGRG